MCQECGCGIVGEVGINGTPGSKVDSPLLPASGGPAASPLSEHERLHALGIAHEHRPEQEHEHEHGHEHGHSPGHTHEHAHHQVHEPEHQSGATPPHNHRTLEVQTSILAQNDRLAERNRGYFKAKGLLVLNVLSSPGSGKTTLIEKTAAALAPQLRTGVIVGDLATDRDAERLRTVGVPVVQITTGTVCHLEAEMVARALTKLKLEDLDLLIIENVGNLVCPAAYDLGEDLRVVILSVTEGEDKPLKYPPMFHSAHVAVITKIDLAAAVEFQREAALANLRRMSPGATVFELSARSGQGIEAWCNFLAQQRQQVKPTG